jgi:uncharacterized iron-regulated membrane protein
MLLVFRWEIIRFFEHDKYSVSHSDKPPLNIDDLVVKAEQNTNGNVSIIYTENRPNHTKTYTMRIKTENNKNLEAKHRFCSIDPYTGEMSEKSFSPLVIFFYIVTKLHTSLFLPNPIGKIVVGSATLIFVIITLSGFCLWLPVNFRNIKSWKNGFIVQFRKGKIQLINDLHKTLGFYVLIPMLLMALTGLAWSFQWFNNGVQMIFNAKPNTYIPVKLSLKNPDAKRLPLDFFDKKANEILAPHKDGHRRIYVPDYDNDPVMIMEWRKGMLNLGAFDRIQFNQYTGEVLKFDRFEDKPIGTKIILLFPQLHYGDIFGLPSKIIYFIACLFATTLPITGVMIWCRKLRKKPVNVNFLETIGTNETNGRIFINRKSCIQT